MKPKAKPAAVGSRVVSRSGLDETIDAFTHGNTTPHDQYLAELAEIRAQRSCPSCEHVGLPCPNHGVPAEDRGQWIGYPDLGGDAA